MRLNAQSDYALRLLMQLAVNPNALVTISEVAQRFRVSRNHLMKIAQALGHHGFIETVRGRSGGLRLSAPPQDISVGAVVRKMEGDFALVECLPGGNGQCIISSACQLTGILNEALDAFLSVLDSYTLADLTGANARLAKILSLRAA
ncbi:MAG: Rrf2 family transcriptional regulator [Pseudomonadota bacterium]